MSEQFTTTRRVAFAETDMAGIMHFTNFYRFMEDTEHEFFRSLGLSIIERRDDGSVISWPRVSASCDFEAPAAYEDILEIRLDVLRKGVKSLTLQFEFFNGETRIARGEMKTVCCLFQPGEPVQSIEIPPEYSNKINESSTTKDTED